VIPRLGVAYPLAEEVGVEGGFVAGTENVTVLFTDLVSSTELSSSLSPEAADEVRRTHFAVLREAISAAGGTEVKTTGDGLMVAFDATAPALSCAVAMQQGIERHNRRSSVPLAIRIGISTGDVTVEGGDYFGETVVEAARLCATTEGGQVLAAEGVKILARRSGHRFAGERELELKGFPEPVVAWEVVWEPAGPEGTDAARMPLPPRLPPAPGIGLVGRKVELDRLTEALKAVAAGEPARIVLVSGEAGVGKSTLTASVARDAHRDGAVVLYGRCDEDLAIPHRPFVEALGHYLVHAEAAELSTLGDERLSALATLVPELRTRLPDLGPTATSDPDAGRWMLYGAGVGLLDLASVDSPVVLVLDDLHWADRPTLQLLRHMVGNLSGRVLVLGIYRDVDLSASHPLTDTLAALTREPSATRLPVSGLDDEEVVSFVEAAAGQTLGQAGVEFAHALYQETDGNPFFVGEMLRHLVETRSVVHDASGRWMPSRELEEAGLPDSVRQVIGARVGRLGDEAAKVLGAASVLGQEFDVDLVGSVMGLAEDPILDVLEAAVSSALVADVRGTSGRFRFTHALIQHTLYEDLGGARRSRLHRSAAEALEERLGQNRDARAGELARHWLAATRPEDASKAVTYARLAGEGALGSLAPAEAIRWFTTALTTLAQAPDDGEQCRCLVGLGEAQRQLGDATYGATLLQAARMAHGRGDVDTLVKAVLANHRGAFSAGGAGMIDAKRIAALETALEVLPATDSSSRARVLALLALERSWDGDYPSRRAIADQALAMARRLGDAATLLDVLLRRCFAVQTPDNVEELLAESIEAGRLAANTDDQIGQFWSACVQATLAVQLGHLDQVTRCTASMEWIAAAVGQPLLGWTAALHLGWSSLLAGDLVGAEGLAGELLRLGTELGDPDALTASGGLLLSLRWQQGRSEEVLDMILQLAADTPTLPLLRACAAWFLVEARRNQEASTMLADEVSSEFSAPDDYLLPGDLSIWARVAYHLGERPAAEALYDRLSRWPHLVTFVGASVLGTVAQALGVLAAVLGRYDDAESHFTQALALGEKVKAPFLIAEAKLDLGRMLLNRRAEGDMRRAEQMLTSARDTAQSYGFAALEQRAVETLTALS
jgi:class 3 adenylate cyclase/tetratricopeptide (TPR) repeat protein